MIARRSTRISVFLLVLGFLIVGGATAFFYAIHKNVDPAVEADMDAHFAAIDHISTSPDPDLNVPHLFGNESAPSSSPETKLSGKQSQHQRAKNKKSQQNAKKGFRTTSTTPVVPGIVQINGDTWIISKALLKTARRNLSEYVGSTVAELAEDQSGPIGFRLRHVNRGSYLRAIGLRSNDVLLAINGHRLNSLENVTMAIASFQNSTRFRLDILRKETQRSLYYKIDGLEKRE